MGDVVKSMKRALRNGKAWTLVLAAASIWSGCAAASPESVSLSSEPVPPAAAPAALPATISRLAVVEGAPGTRIELVADSGLVWTTYRDADGALVIELPNARPLAGVGAENPPAGLVSSVDVAVDETSGRPLTRLTVQTRQEAEHTLVAGQNSLHIDLTPVGTATAAAAPAPAGEVAEMATLAEEAAPSAPSAIQPAPAAQAETLAPVPLATQAAAVPVAAPRQVSFAALGTPDQPLLAPPPTGRRALLLGSVEVIEEGANTVVRVGGDGEFAYSTFQLSNPDRFVIDLDGVVNQSARSSAPLAGEILARIRVSQFKQSPEAVSRVVFDLRQTVAPTIERGPEGLVVRFAAAAPDAAQLTMAQTIETIETTETTETTETAAPETTEIASTLPETRPEPQEMTSPSAFAEPASPAAPDATVATAAETLGASDVQAYAATEAPAVAEPVARVPAPAPAAVAPAGRPVTPRDSSLFEAADMQAEEAPRPAVSSSAVFAQQNVGGTHKEYVGETISLSLKDGDIKDVLRSFAKISGLNVVLQPGVRGTVTVELESVPWDQALDQILKINNLGYELDGNIMRIAPRNVLEAEAKEQQALAQAQALSIPLRTVIKRISYSSASDLARVLASGGGRASGILSQRGSVTVDARTNTLIIKELPSYIDTVIAVIETLDIPEPQVMIEARIIETTKRFSRTLGIRWGFEGVADAAHGNTTGLQFPNNGNVQGDVNVAHRRQQRPAALRPGQHPRYVQSRRDSPGRRERRPDQHPFGAEDRHPEQRIGEHPVRSPDPDPDGRQQHGDRAVRERDPAPRRDAACHRRGHGAHGCQHPEAGAAARFRGRGSAERADLDQGSPDPRHRPRRWHDGDRRHLQGVDRPGRRTGCRAWRTFRSSAICSRTVGAKTPTKNY